MSSLWWFVFGAMMGSVANALIYRLPNNISWAKGRSICPKCKHELGFWDLIPLLSFIFLQGKCRYCNKNIGIRYFLTELIMAIAFILLSSNFLLMGIFWVTMVIAIMDWETRLVSEIMILLWGILTVILQIIPILPIIPISNIIGLVIAVGFIGVIWVLSKGRAMGFGDVEIAVVMGLWLGWPNILIGLWMAFVVGAIVGVWKLIKGQSKLKSEIAFGPFLVIGSWIGYLWGGTILRIFQL